MLMIPGPSDPEPQALAELALPILPHYGKKWAEFYKDTLSKLQKVFRTSNEVIILPAPGSVGVEMAAENLVKKGDEAFVCMNGYFSEMIDEIIKSHGGVSVPVLGKGLGHPVTVEDVKRVLDGSKDVSGKCLFVVHNETSTGVANPVAKILEFCKNKGMITILDSISAFGGMDIRVDEWRADFCIGYPSKALGGVFGAIPISISEECWNVAKKNSREIQGRFVSLNVWREYIDEWGAIGHPHPSTMPTSIIAAMNKALDLALAEGLEKRYERHKRVAAMMRKGISSLGLEIFPDKNYLSNTVSVANIDPRYDEKLRSELVKKYDILISGGLGKLRGKIIRIGHMGTSATVPCISITLEAIRSVFENLKK